MMSILKMTTWKKISVLSVLAVIFTVRLILRNFQFINATAKLSNNGRRQFDESILTTPLYFIKDRQQQDDDDDAQQQQRQQLQQQQKQVKALKRFGIQSFESDIAYLDHCDLDLLFQLNDNKTGENFQIFFHYLKIRMKKQGSFS